MHVLYEDNHLIAVYKPAGVLVQGDASGDRTLMDDVKDYIKKKYNKPGDVFLGLLHRLDKPTSGIILFARTSKGASRLSTQFRNREIKKTYHALVEGKLEKTSGTLINYLRKNDAKYRMEVFDDETKDSKRAELDYTVVDVIRNNTLVKINLKTGRKHQIRAQFAHSGHPVVGDVKYGAEHKLQDGSIRLCATTLQFTTATGGEEKTIEIDVPEEWCIKN